MIYEPSLVYTHECNRITKRFNRTTVTIARVII
jgi:hypothetical protein